MPPASLRPSSHPAPPPSPPLSQYDRVTPNLVAWLVYLAKQVATVSKRKRWRVGVSTRVRGDLESHNHWNKGISSVLRFMSDADLCPTSSPLILSIQKRRRTL